ncbi:MAG: hypothetical protein WA542_09725, partial [Candidatus Acidiferrum sp.]
RSDFPSSRLMVSSTRRTAGCGPACPVVWEGRTGNRLPYPDCEVDESVWERHMRIANAGDSRLAK